MSGSCNFGSGAVYCYGKKSSDGKTITWYSDAYAGGQLNSDGDTYYYFAIS
jgi:hypothetical protein